MATSIAFYMESGSTEPAAGKNFTLYGMEIGVFAGVRLDDLHHMHFFHPVNGAMKVPITTKMPIPIFTGGVEVKGPIMNPVLRDIIQVD